MVAKGAFMRKMSYSELLNSARLMLGGLKNHRDTLGRRGVDADFLAGFAGLQARAADLNSEQETLKARLKVKTSELEQVLAQLGRQHSEAKKLVKLDIP